MANSSGLSRTACALPACPRSAELTDPRKIAGNWSVLFVIFLSSRPTSAWRWNVIILRAPEIARKKPKKKIFCAARRCNKNPNPRIITKAGDTAVSRIPFKQQRRVYASKSLQRSLGTGAYRNRRDGPRRQEACHRNAGEN